MDDFLARAEQTRNRVRDEIRSLASRRGGVTGGDCGLVLQRLGWTGVSIPHGHGGRGQGFLDRVAAIEEATRIDRALGASLSAATLGTGLLLEFGNDEQRARWLPGLSSGQDVMTICMTEPDSGSHLLGMATTARRRDGGWVLNGRKWFIGNAHLASLHGVIARTGDGAHAGALSGFVVEAGRPGCSAGVEHEMAGLRGFSIGEVVFDDCWVPDDHLVGEVGDGLPMAHTVVTRHGKPNIGAVALGVLASTLDLACEHSQSRVLYGRPIAALGTTQQRLADVYTALYSARLALYHAADRIDQGRDHDIGMLVGKLLASEGAVRSALNTVELMGARGCDPAIGAIQLLNDALMTQAPSGTADVNRQRIAQIALGTYKPAMTRNRAAS